MKQYESAESGKAVPLGVFIANEKTHSNPIAHSYGNTNSTFTSWSVSETTATNFARTEGSGGILLKKEFKLSEVMRIMPQFTNNYDETKYPWFNTFGSPD